MKDLTIAISGLPGSGNSTAGKSLAEKLSLEYFSVGQMVKEICRGNYASQKYYPELKNFLESTGLEIPILNCEDETDAAHKFWKETKLGQSKEFNNFLDELQTTLGRKGGMVLDGKLALYMVDSAHYKFWITADFETRARRNAEKEKTSLEVAKQKLIERQEDERNGLIKIYNLDIWEQEREANLVVDTSNLSSEQVLSKLLNYINNKV